MKNTKTKMVCAVMAMLLMLSCFAGCAKAEADPTETTGELLAVVTDATEPEKEAFISSSRYQATLPGEAGKPSQGTAATEGTEPAATNPATSTPATGNGTSNPGNHNHSYTKGATVAPTCTSDGYTAYKCSCGDSYRGDTVSAYGHSWGDWVTTVEATSSAEGTETRTCATCGATESQSIPKVEVTLDYAAVAAYGNSYAANAYGYWYNPSAPGYFPAYSASVEYVLSNGGMDYLYMRMAEGVDSLNYDMIHFGETGSIGVCCFCWESNGMIWLQVNYG